jgi:hypothetical protein
VSKGSAGASKPLLTRGLLTPDTHLQTDLVHTAVFFPPSRSSLLRGEELFLNALTHYSVLFLRG